MEISVCSREHSNEPIVFAHDVTAVLSWHVQNNCTLTVLEPEIETQIWIVKEKAWEKWTQGGLVFRMLKAAHLSKATLVINYVLASCHLTPLPGAPFTNMD